MSAADYIDQKAEELRRKTEKLRQRQFNEGYAVGYGEGHAEGRAWVGRMREAQERGKAFDEPFPVSELPVEQIEDGCAGAGEITWFMRLRMHWVWPHLMVLLTICVLAALIALGFGVVWLVRQLAGVVGGGTIFIAVLLIGVYLFLWNIYRPQD